MISCWGVLRSKSSVSPPAAFSASLLLACWRPVWSTQAWTVRHHLFSTAYCLKLLKGRAVSVPHSSCWPELPAAWSCCSSGVPHVTSHHSPSLSLGFKLCWRRKKSSTYNYFFLKDEISYNALMMEVNEHNSCLVSTHCLKLILISTVFLSMCHFNSHCEKLCFLMYYCKCDDTLLF